MNSTTANTRLHCQTFLLESRRKANCNPQVGKDIALAKRRSRELQADFWLYLSPSASAIEYLLVAPNARKKIMTTSGMEWGWLWNKTTVDEINWHTSTLSGIMAHFSTAKDDNNYHCCVVFMQFQYFLNENENSTKVVGSELDANNPIASYKMRPRCGGAKIAWGNKNRAAGKQFHM
ncbi:hypothetical protein BDZ91DRAFT_758128 [Kalaharituber pfeilii]|nr:hypothetical protein BDZ91DRAFT_758128 [Kalaharituber pfeilii]